MTAPEPIPPTAAPRVYRVLFCSAEKLRCPYGHRLRIAHRPQFDATLTCTHKDPRTGHVCNTLCWFAIFTVGGSERVPRAGERLWAVLEVTPAIVRHFSRTPMTLLERLAYLGHTMPGVDLDLFGGTTE